MCERCVETGTDCYIDPNSSLGHSSTSFASWLGLLNCGSLRAQPSVSWFSRWHSCLNWPTAAGTLSIFFLNVHLLPPFFGLFTQVHLLIDGSVEGQHVTFFSKAVLLPLHPIIDMASCILLFYGIIFCRCFGRSCFVCATWTFLSILKVSLLLHIFFLSISSSCMVRFVCCFVLTFSSRNIPVFFLP